MTAPAASITPNCRRVTRPLASYSATLSAKWSLSHMSTPHRPDGYTVTGSQYIHQKLPACRVRKGRGMAKLVFGMNQSLDGYVDHMRFAPTPAVFRQFVEDAQRQVGSIYGRHVYELMR